jgi:MFS family permease
MAAIKAITLWYPPERWGLITGFHMMGGGLGAMAATLPIQWSLSVISWQGLFFWLAGVCLVVSAILFTVVPERGTPPASGTLRDQFRITGIVLTNGFFWRIQPLPIVVGDENMLRQVWLNLLSNAVKYSAGSEPATVEVTYVRQDDGQYRFDVRDNGVGFDMAYSGKLFGVFQRLHAVSEFEGTGIGLASVRRVLARHGGRIWADAKPGEGATFSFTLPASADSPHTGSLP